MAYILARYALTLPFIVTRLADSACSPNVSATPALAAGKLLCFIVRVAPPYMRSGSRGGRVQVLKVDGPGARQHLGSWQANCARQAIRRGLHRTSHSPGNGFRRGSGPPGVAHACSRCSIPGRSKRIRVKPYLPPHSAIRQHDSASRRRAGNCLVQCKSGAIPNQACQVIPVSL